MPDTKKQRGFKKPFFLIYGSIPLMLNILRKKQRNWGKKKMKLKAYLKANKSKIKSHLVAIWFTFLVSYVWLHLNPRTDCEEVAQAVRDENWEENGFLNSHETEMVKSMKRNGVKVSYMAAYGSCRSYENERTYNFN